MNTELSERMSCASWQQACHLLWVSCHSSSPGSTSSTHCLVIKENNCKYRGGPNKSDQSYQWSSARLAVHVYDWVQLHGWACITVSSNLWLNDSGLMNRGKVGTSPHPPALAFFLHLDRISSPQSSVEIHLKWFKCFWTANRCVQVSLSEFISYTFAFMRLPRWSLASPEVLNTLQQARDPFEIL